MLRSGGPINSSNYSNPQVDGLIDKARTETDQTSRQALYKQIRQIVREDSPLVFVHYETINYLMRKNVEGSTVNPTLGLRLENVGFSG